jgi:hypothetical protein
MLQSVVGHCVTFVVKAEDAQKHLMSGSTLSLLVRKAEYRNQSARIEGKGVSSVSANATKITEWGQFAATGMAKTDSQKDTAPDPE